MLHLLPLGINAKSLSVLFLEGCDKAITVMVDPRTTVSQHGVSCVIWEASESDTQTRSRRPSASKRSGGAKDYRTVMPVKPVTI